MQCGPQSHLLRKCLAQLDSLQSQRGARIAPTDGDPGSRDFSMLRFPFGAEVDAVDRTAVELATRPRCQRWCAETRVLVVRRKRRAAHEEHPLASFWSCPIDPAAADHRYSRAKVGRVPRGRPAVSNTPRGRAVACRRAAPRTARHAGAPFTRNWDGDMGRKSCDRVDGPKRRNG
jgi:hypothetical protein